MSHSSSITTQPSVSGVIKAIKLTNWGEIFVSAFPLEAITWADTHFFRSTINAQDPFKKFVKLCVDWCSTQGVRPAWREMYAQQRLQGQPTDAKMYVSVSPKGSEALGGNRSATCPTKVEALPLLENEVLISGTKYRVLDDDQALQRRNTFTANAEAVAGIEKLARLIGKGNAETYFNKVFYNLRYEEVFSE